MTRREWCQRLIVVSVVPCVGISGCDNKKAQNVIGQGASVVAALIFAIPHPIAKVLGVALVGGGAMLTIEAQYEDGTTGTVNVALTTEQKQRVEKGEEVQIKDARGKLTTTKPSKK